MENDLADGVARTVAALGDVRLDATVDASRAATIAAIMPGPRPGSSKAGEPAP